MQLCTFILKNHWRRRRRRGRLGRAGSAVVLRWIAKRRSGGVGGGENSHGRSDLFAQRPGESERRRQQQQQQQHTETRRVGELRCTRARADLQSANQRQSSYLEHVAQKRREEEEEAESEEKRRRRTRAKRRGGRGRERREEEEEDEDVGASGPFRSPFVISLHLDDANVPSRALERGFTRDLGGGVMKNPRNAALKRRRAAARHSDRKCDSL
ncbi:hypothetical protein F2P81_002978 [Scophthalmus maximus]|uniref:Uncharacterized protein n=1 Tax=Scophthalmus maximus TaxID=52904 RepID=A0A6A4TJJ4_SCOMX|nr:hypothetical protein F2P81_002978 [Scophthalmus maximus]